MQGGGFGPIDWAVLASYFVFLALTAALFSRIKVTSSFDYFVGGRKMPFWAAAVSLLATSQSAATFLGGPEYSYAKDLTFIGFYLSSFLAIYLVAKFLIPRFYAVNARTVYELLEIRYGQEAKRYGAIMFLLGRVLASGARLFIGALAVSMILFLDIEAPHVALSVAILILAALAYAYFGGVGSVILSDVFQAIAYVAAAFGVAVYLWMELSLPAQSLYQTLYEAGKLKIIDTSLNGSFNVWGLFSGWLLLNIAAYGLDQDMVQRTLTCRDARSAQRSMYFNIALTVPVALLFLLIGLLLYLYYHQFETQAPLRSFEGERITVFMYFILHEMPEGLRGLVTVGAIAAALSSSNSVLSAMASVALEDLYRPWKERKGGASEAHYLKIGRRLVLMFAFLLALTAMLCFYWQRYGDLPLLSFALGVMSFAYAGLLGVYGAAIFTQRGSARGVLIALVLGFVTILALQPYTFGVQLEFGWQILLGTLAAFGAMLLVEPKGSRRKAL